MRRFWIHNVLPVAFAAVPVLMALLLFAAIPPGAREKYFEQVAKSPIDWIIIGLGLSLFVCQIGMSWKALRWREDREDFDHRADRWVNHLSQGAEWFPLLGLIGTVVAILLTFANIKPTSKPSEIIEMYGPAITATGGGLYMAFINILPYWVVGAGRDLIRALGGYAPAPETLPPEPPLSGGKK
ncbi:MAG TPA: MotA/TolQ/ExbB proton channel family protein [Gemmata sp.]|nr:MotA/TolQ/ExbB proton channel family protein [Gemmata sp.]